MKKNSLAVFALVVSQAIASTLLTIGFVLCGGVAIADGVVTNFWTGGNSEGGGWATASNWS